MSVWAVLIGFILSARAQSPGSLGGSALGLVVTSGGGSLPASGYSFQLFGNAGNAWQIVNLSGTADSSGACSYSSSGATAHLDWTDNAGGNFATDFSFDSGFSGTYTLNDNNTQSQQQGNFILFNGTAPSAVAGQYLICTVNDGAGNFAVYGAAALVFAPSGNGYTVQGDGLDVPDSSGTYSYTKINTAVGRLVMNDSVHGIITNWLAFADTASGSFGTVDSAAGFQVGDFTIADIVQPTINITYPSASQRVSNEVITVTGRAADNSAVSTVLYSLNGLDWFEAGSSDNWSNWTANIVLNPGTNVIQACAMDTSGNVSRTNTVSFYYVVSAPLSVSVNNTNNKVSPNFDRAFLEVGKTIKLTAQPAFGYAFTNWTDGAGNVVTNQPALSFVMQRGLSFIANFVDIGKPSTIVTSPRPSQRYSNNVCTVTGKAMDNDKVIAVYLSVNNGGWTATALNGTNWSSTAALVAGTNHLAIVAMDASGNLSKTNDVYFQYVPCAYLTVNSDAGGKVLPPLNGALVALGQKVTLNATPKAGFAFVKWTDVGGNILTNRQTLTFTMASNLAFTASFVDTNRPVLTLRTGDGTNFTGQLRVTGRASDNDAVAMVYCNLNNSGWIGVNSSDLWSNWWSDISLIPGTNLCYFVAADRTGNYSAIRQLKILMQTAPLNLGGLKLRLLPNEGDPVEFSFGAKSFGQVSVDTNVISGAGTYTYTRLSPNTGRLQIGYTAPPQAAASLPQSYNLTFSAPRIGNYSSADGTSIGSLTFTGDPEMTITSLTARTIFYFGSSGNGLSTYYNRGTNYSTNLNNGYSFIGRTLSLTKFSPSTFMLKQTNSDETLYIVCRYTGDNNGLASIEHYSLTGSYLGRDAGWFGVAAQSPVGYPPAGLGGRVLHVREGVSQMNLLFGDTTFSQQSLSPNLLSGVGNQTYSVTGINTASLYLSFVAPVNINGSTRSDSLTFYAPNLAYLTHADGTVSGAVMDNLANLANGASIGKTLSLTNSVGGVSTVQVGSDGNTTFSGVLNGKASYSWSNYSPASDMLQLNFWSGGFSGYSGWLQLDYLTATAGSYKFTLLDLANNPLAVEQGMFGQQ